MFSMRSMKEFVEVILGLVPLQRKQSDKATIGPESTEMRMSWYENATVPTVRGCHPSTSGRVGTHFESMVVRPMGNRLNQTSTPSKRTNQVRYSCCRLFHQMGRCRTSGNNNKGKSEEFRVAEHYMSIRNTKRNYN